MNNEDFRRLLATPSARSASSADLGKAATASSASVAKFTHRQVGAVAVAAGGNGSAAAAKKPKKKRPFSTFHHSEGSEAGKEGEDDLFDESQARLAEIMKNYRDRAAERRKGLGSDEDGKKKGASGYKAVPGNFFSSNSLEEARMLEIQKSKYLGGDMEHTHLVKGLDYSLLNKVRTEMQEREVADREREDDELKGTLVASESSKATNTKLAANICKILFENKQPKRNDLFSRGRMAYVVELEDEEADVPSTLLRSVLDCPVDQSSENINADNLLINKLTQVLAYLRTDVKKRRKGGTSELIQSAVRGAAELNIFEGVDEYKPGKEKREQKEREDRQNRDGQRKNTSYFDSEKDRSRDEGSDRNRERERHRERRGEHGETDRKRERMEDESEAMAANDENLEKIKKRRMEQEDAYAELYPGGLGMVDAGGESDEEADYTKMDMGNRKGPVKRWDFETQDEYERYQGMREANPKAAYQFGVKTSGGRKTRKSTVAAKERKLDRELEKINKILDKGTNSKIRY